MKTLLKYLKPFYVRMIVGIFIKFIATMAELMLPMILSHILAEVVYNQELGDIVFWGMLMILCSAIAWIGNIIANRYSALVSRNFAEVMRKDLFQKTLMLSARQTDMFTIPSLESRITTDTYNVKNFIAMMQRMGTRAPIMLVGGIAITLIMDANLALVMIVMAPLLFGTILFVRSRGVPMYRKIQQAVDGMVRVVREDSQGIRVIKALSKTDYEHRRFDAVNRSLVNSETRAGIVMGSVNPIMTFFMNMGIVGVVALAAFRVSNGTSSPETVVAFMQYFTQISMALMSVTRIFISYTKASASANRISEVLLTKEDLTVKSKTDYPDIKTDNHITFENVSFSYKGKKNNLENISFELKKGGSVGIIGATGSGKSTLIKLLLRFYDTDKGAIRINGEDIRTIEKDRLYKMFGSVHQHDFLYAETIEENIRFGRDITDEQIRKAAEIAQADGFITSFADGFKHMLSSHGTNISGGQKQRILISRAIAAHPEILILDDSSSALDYKTDAALREQLKVNMGDTTLVTVAQRVSTIKDCSLIIVLDHGKIISMGTHEHLLETCVEYREISDSQMGGAFVE